MKTTQKIFQVCLILTLTLGLLAPAAMMVSARPARMNSLLSQMVAEDPGQTLRVIVQRASNSDLAERFVEKIGGQVLKDLPLIDAFAAQMPAKDVPKLAVMASVNWVYLDAPIRPTGKPVTTATFTLLDTFSTADYNNNDGTASWTSDWIKDDVSIEGQITYDTYLSLEKVYDETSQTTYLVETIPTTDPAGGVATTGNVFISNGELILQDRPDTGTQPSAARQADLSDGVTSATLSYVFRVGPGVDPNEDIIIFEVSTDGGTSYTTLSTLSFKGGTSSTSFRNILSYASAQTRFRFRVLSGYDGPDEYFAVDNFKIEYEGNALPNSTYLDTLGVREVWDMGYTGAGIGVAVIDSGISQDRDFTSVQKLSFSSNSTTVNDVYGHGTHVAGIIAGNGTDSGGQYMGVAPDTDLISLKISDETGMAYESDTVDAMQWVFNHKEQYNIRVVNLSVQSTIEQSYHDSALNAAAEILWFNGIVVVAATGNWYGGNVYPLNSAPANDPFVITVGAVDEKGTTKIKDDRATTFSVWGLTQDGFFKPEIFAPGVDIISVLSKDSSWDVEYPDRSVFSGQYFRISGTSMATPMVSGAVALLLQSEPDLTPDQVKYRVMNAKNWAGSSPYLSIDKMLTTPSTESANQGVVPHMLLAKMAMIAYWASQNGEEIIDWENVDWAAVNWNAVNWNAVNWNAVNWNAVNWNAVNWNAVNWNAVNWNAVNWNAVNWNAVNWNAVNWNAVSWEE